MPRLPSRIRRDEKGRLFVEVSADSDTPDVKARALREADLAMSKAKYIQAMTAVMGFAPQTNDKRDLMRLGEWLRARTFQHDETEAGAEDLFKEIILANNNEKGPDVGYSRAVLTEPEYWIHMAAARWADQTFPVVTMGERYFAALITARTPPERIPQIRSPWKAFVIDIPPNSLSVFDYDDGVRVPISRVLVHCIDHGDGDLWWRWVAFTPSGHKQWREGTTEAIATPVKITDPEHERYGLEVPAFEEHVGQDERMFLLIGNLILNVCEALTNPDYSREHGGSHEKYRIRLQTGKKGASGMAEPEARTYVLGKPIKIDCREQLRAYVEGTRESREVTVSFLVRGHFKPKLSERVKRLVFIVPYMKRKDQAPILVREHALSDPEPPERL